MALSPMRSNAPDKPRRSHRRQADQKIIFQRGNATMKPTRRSLVLGALAAPLAGTARADTWPSGTIKIIVPFPPGGSVDPIARMAQPGLQQKLNANIVIENRPGSSGSLGNSLVAKPPPDGNTWLFVFDSHAVNPFLMDLDFDTVKDLAPVMLIGDAPNVIAT